MTSGVSITVDVDGETGLPDGGRAYGQRLTSRSERSYGLRRGLPRVLDALREAGARATFYVPGRVARLHPDEIGGVLEAGHELGHHGHTHRRPDRLSAREQRVELEEGLASLAALGGVGAVRGYRAPGWELTPVTLAALGALGFTHDSSLMGDDRPYRVPAGAVELVELPVHWSLDDAPHFGRTTDPAALAAVWEDELARALAERRHVTFTLHPEILGRPHRIAVLRRLLERIADAGARHVTHAEAAAAA